ncbi:DNA topoisomerase I [Candidatus Berkelbacteria bacterium CG1_02_42_45]|uniref:DNA topoisomerase 1 n=1 Tax=Candidatus Berkelbacteria bacterium CG1_02_42_45 TaxID=1805036 RepID=A0A1J4RS10_9BACT|nr:MAG: DNA topoisomerase I [Candidatus Berkelbacteria bacterium CG1_02_42_45]
MNLVVVESPAKAKTIERYLGGGFKVLASFGHVRDLPKKELGVDVARNYEPTYVVPSDSKKTIALLKKEQEKAKELYLATDLDREGEAIAWHIVQALGLQTENEKLPVSPGASRGGKTKNYKRITFNEITRSAITKAIKNPRDIDINLVDAQQARRILDRLVGYKLSPLLWKKVKSGLSAGRVQTVAVRLIVEREREIEKFKPEEYWILAVLLSKKEDALPAGRQELKFKAFLVEEGGKPIDKLGIKTGKDAKRIESRLKEAKYKVLSVDKNDMTRHPSAPFTTSTIQMEASRKLGYSVKQTMSLAQRLYEAGKITYMRTDSTNLSSQAVAAIRKLIEKEYGKKYLPAEAQKYVTKAKHAQEAHEAIRPTHFERKGVSNDPREQNLYELIWMRAVASQMADALMEVIKARILAQVKEKFVFLARGESIKFDGFIKVYTEGRDDETAPEVIKIPELSKNEALDFHELFKEQKFTEPPKRYTEATLVKKLEGLGIGRPSTYAPTMSTIQERGYVRLEDRRFLPEEIGKIVNDVLVEHFADLFDYKFTAQMEDELDEIAEGKRKWQTTIDNFYQPFSKQLSEKNKELDKKDIAPEKKVGEKCPECGKPLVERFGKFGKFIACSGYPECKYSRPVENKKEMKNAVVAENGEKEKVSEVESEKCEKCQGKMILKEGRFGKFLACENYPKCKNTKTIVIDTKVKCPECEKGTLVERRTKRGRTFWGCSTYPDCKYATWNDPSNTDSKHGSDTDRDQKQ